MTEKNTTDDKIAVLQDWYDKLPEKEKERFGAAFGTMFGMLADGLNGLIMSMQEFLRNVHHCPFNHACVKKVKPDAGQ